MLQVQRCKFSQFRYWNVIVIIVNRAKLLGFWLENYYYSVLAKLRSMVAKERVVPVQQ